MRPQVFSRDMQVGQELPPGYSLYLDEVRMLGRCGSAGHTQVPTQTILR